MLNSPNVSQRQRFTGLCVPHLQEKKKKDMKNLAEIF